MNGYITRRRASSFRLVQVTNNKDIDRPIILFLKGLLGYWWALMSCAAFTFLGVWVAYANKRRDWILWGSFLLGIAFLMIAAYRTWLKEHRRSLDEMVRSAAVIQRLVEQLLGCGPPNRNGTLKPIVRAMDRAGKFSARSAA